MATRGAVPPAQEAASSLVHLDQRPDPRLVSLVWLWKTFAMATVNVQEAKTHLSALIARAEAGEEVIIARAGRPVLRLVPIDGPPARVFGGMDFVVPDDFDAPLSDEELSEWE